jgi:hypothetical protein
MHSEQKRILKKEVAACIKGLRNLSGKADMQTEGQRWTDRQKGWTEEAL